MIKSRPYSQYIFPRDEGYDLHSQKKISIFQIICHPCIKLVTSMFLQIKQLKHLAI